MAALRVAFLSDLSGPADWIESGYFLRFGGKYQWCVVVDLWFVEEIGVFLSFKYSHLRLRTCVLVQVGNLGLDRSMIVFLYLGRVFHAQ